MKLELLKAGLQKLVDEDNNQEAKQAIAEINEIQQRVAWNDAFEDECYILYASDVVDMMNLITYDEYGKLYAKYKAYADCVSFNRYEDVCRDYLGLFGLPLSVIQLGFDTVGDLHRENEEYGNNNSDGTFKHNE